MSGSCAKRGVDQDRGVMKSNRNLMLLAVCYTFVGIAKARTPKWEYLAVSAALKNRNFEQMLNTREPEGWE